MAREAILGATHEPAGRHGRGQWRVVDIVVTCVLGVVFGVVYWAWGAAWGPLTLALNFAPPLAGLGTGVWLVAGVLGGLVVRRPGAAVLAELVAALVEALIGNQWGFSSVWYGVLEGLGAEVVFAITMYRLWNVATAVLAGVGAAAAGAALDIALYYPAFSGAEKAVYAGAELLSGVLIAGLGAWALTRALAQTGALAPLASGRAARRV